VLILGRSLFLAIELQLSPKPYFGHETPKLISLPIELSKVQNQTTLGIRLVSKVALPIYVFLKIMEI
jgi:hypothetical protein